MMKTFWPSLSRRDFFKTALVGSAFLGMAAFWKWRKTFPWTGGIQGANHGLGHLLKLLPLFPREPGPQHDVLIIGGGVSGLSAAWWLQKNQFKNFCLLEMDDEVGGNSRSGKNEVSAYPWGAHYVPLPSEEARYVRELFEELGVITGFKNNLPVYNEYYLCADPEERLFVNGKWQDSHIPQVAITEDQRRQYNEFFAEIQRLKKLVGADGKPAFAIPLVQSSQDPELLKLDQITFRQWVEERGWTSEYLHWYLNYCCRDDFGAPFEQVSAWAGIHYFASRSGQAANAESDTVLTWPEGNGWLVNQLAQKVKDHLQKNSFVIGVKKAGELMEIEVLDTKTKKVKVWTAKHVIFAAPRFIANRVVKDSPQSTDSFEYSPWLVANITLKKFPLKKGEQLAWDNVNYYSRSLGYVVATHQSLTQSPSTVISYYKPLDEQDPKAERQKALQKSYNDWAEEVVQDLQTRHPEMVSQIQNLDVWIWGHGMIIPRPGFIWGEGREARHRSHGTLHFAHSDMSGISIFEEAQYWGVEAAKKCLKALS